MTDLPFSTTRNVGARPRRARRRRTTRVALVLAGGLALVPGASEPVAAQRDERERASEARVEEAGARAGEESGCEARASCEPASARPRERRRVRPEPRVDAQLALARVCASEIGLSGSPEECAAIHDVLSRRAERWNSSLTWAARAYSNRVFDAERSDTRAWVAHLRPDGGRPDGWPTRVTLRRRGEARVVRHAPWGAYRDRWLALYEAAGRIVRGEIESPCAGRVDHWGMRSGVDWERAQRAGWEEVDCGDTRNAFWRVPERQEG